MVEQSVGFGRFAIGLFAALATVHSTHLDAHAYPVLDAAVPGPGSVLEEAPDSVCIQFNNFIQRNLSRLMVTDEQGDAFQRGELEYRANNTVCTRLRPLNSSSYRVHWSVVGRDGHRTEGDYHFVLQ